MNANALRYKTCLRKRMLGKAEAAQIVDARSYTAKRPLRYYQCPFCKCYHLTHKLWRGIA